MLVSVLLIAHGLAHAEEVRSNRDVYEDVAQLETSMMQQGLALRQSGKDREALNQYRQAYELRHGARALAQMALAEEAMGNWWSAARMLRQALDDGTDDWIQLNRALLEQELVRMDRAAARVTLVLQTSGATVRINGEAIDTATVEQGSLLVAPGGVTIDVARSGYAPIHREVIVREGSTYRETIRLTELRTAVPQAKAIGASGQRLGPTHHSAAARNPWWLVSAGAGVALSLSAAVPWLIADRRVSQLARECRASSRCDIDAVSGEVQTLDRVTNGLLVAGIGTAAISTALYLIVPKSPDARELRLSTWVLPRGMGVTYGRAY